MVLCKISGNPLVIRQVFLNVLLFKGVFLSTKFKNILEKRNHLEAGK